MIHIAAGSGLPQRMKFDSKTGNLTGRPTNPGAFPAIVSVLGNDGKTLSVALPIVVEALPNWATGSFFSLIIPPSPPDDSLTGVGGFLSLPSSPGGSYSASLKLGGKTFAFRGQIEGEAAQERGDQPLRSQATVSTKPGDSSQDIILNLEFRPQDHAEAPGFMKAQNPKILFAPDGLVNDLRSIDKGDMVSDSRPAVFSKLLEPVPRPEN